MAHPVMSWSSMRHNAIMQLFERDNN